MAFSEAAYFLACQAGANLKYGGLNKAFQKLGSWQEVWEGQPKEVLTNWNVDEKFQELERQEIRIILKEDPEYPTWLREIPLPPHAIYLRGELPDKDSVNLAVVGTRRATDFGKRLAEEIAEELARAGVNIISGLAFGIDVAAHSGCLKSGGKAVAILASGVDKITPRSNANLGEKILLSGGAILSEYPPDSPILAHQFLERNRIISGLASAVLIVEAPERSGSLATARFALEQNRNVLVVPGPANHPNYQGSHSLIRAGAILTANAQQVAEEIGVNLGDSKAKKITDLSEKEKLVLDLLEKAGEPLSIDRIILNGKLEIQDVSRALTGLTLANLIQETARGFLLR